MPNEQDEKLNKLLGRQGSIAERTRIAKNLDDEKLQMAAPYSPQAKEELERRRYERLLASRAPFMTYARLSPEEIDSFEQISNVPLKGDVGSKTTYDSRNRFNMVHYKMFLFA